MIVYYKGLEFDVFGFYQPYEPQTLEHKGEQEWYHINELFYEGVNMKDFIKAFNLDVDIEPLEQIALQTYKNN